MKPTLSHFRTILKEEKKGEKGCIKGEATPDIYPTNFVESVRGKVGEEKRGKIPLERKKKEEEGRFRTATLTPHIQ